MALTVPIFPKFSSTSASRMNRHALGTLLLFLNLYQPEKPFIPLNTFDSDIRMSVRLGNLGQLN